MKISKAATAIVPGTLLLLAYSNSNVGNSSNNAEDYSTAFNTSAIPVSNGSTTPTLGENSVFVEVLQ